MTLIRIFLLFVNCLKALGRGLFSKSAFLRGNGDVIYVLLHGALMRDTKRRPRSFIGQVIDVTERKGFEQADASSGLS